MAKKCKKCKYFKECQEQNDLHKKKKHIFKVIKNIFYAIQLLATTICLVYETFFK